MLQLEWPWIFVLAPLPLLVYWLAPRAQHQEAALRVPFYNTLSQFASTTTTFGLGSKVNTLLLILIWLACLAAGARPQWIGQPVQLPASGRDLLVAVDISGSMERADMILENQRVDRLTLVKSVVGNFVRRRTSDRLGLILFGTQAYLQAPLTFDRDAVDTFLQEARLGFAGEQTAIGDAIGLATKRLINRPEANRVLILLTDGANTAGEIDPLQAAQLAQQAQVKIYTIGIGAEEMQVPGLFGSSFGAQRINPSMELDEDSLLQIAKLTGGKYFRARNHNELESIYAELDILEPLEQDTETYRPTLALFYWPLTVALLFSVLVATINLFNGLFGAHSVDQSKGK
jgi:Ca-activated chloride channel family protein